MLVEMLRGRFRRARRCGVVSVFVLQVFGVMFFILGAWLAIGLGELDGQPLPERTKWLLAVVSIAAPLALLSAAVVVSGIADRTWLAPRLAVLFVAFLVNVYGLVDQTRWFFTLARRFDEYRTMGFDRGDLMDAATVSAACALGGLLLVRCAMRAIRFRPRTALLVEG